MPIGFLLTIGMENLVKLERPHTAGEETTPLDAAELCGVDVTALELTELRGVDEEETPQYCALQRRHAGHAAVLPAGQPPSVHPHPDVVRRQIRGV